MEALETLTIKYVPQNAALLNVCARPSGPPVRLHVSPSLLRTHARNHLEQV